MDPHGRDHPSLTLMIGLQLQDLENLTDPPEEKDRDRVKADFALAVEAYGSHLKTIQSFVPDRCMCRSIAPGIITNGDLVHRGKQVEGQATRDQEVALNLDSNQGVPSDDLLGQTQASSSAATRPQSDLVDSMTTCSSCMEEFKLLDVARCPCSHEYCRECLAIIFRVSFSDESLYPPQCCRQVIHLDVNRSFLPPNLVSELLAKQVELEDPIRLYCHEPSCSTFLPARLIKGDVGSCLQCHRQTCAICKGSSHEGDCPKDDAAQQVLRIAAENGWQRCYSCRGIVELDHGCNHMTCHCGAQFCYLCGTRWKNCPCERWNEDRLLNGAAVTANGDVDAQSLGDEDHRCEKCGNHLSTFTGCAKCRIILCKGCEFNGL